MNLRLVWTRFGCQPPPRCDHGLTEESFRDFERSSSELVFFICVIITMITNQECENSGQQSEDKGLYKTYK